MFSKLLTHATAFKGTAPRLSNSRFSLLTSTILFIISKFSEIFEQIGTGTDTYHLVPVVVFTITVTVF